MIESILQAIAIDLSVAFFVVCVRAEMGLYRPEKDWEPSDE